MTHLDEGIVHAWLDGALDEAQSAEVSKHAASCAQCGEMVAEARGFIAGASRILTSLDDTVAPLSAGAPAGVVPMRAAAVASSKPARRYWQAAPWVTGIAAALILAIGVKEWRERPSARVAFLPVPATTADSLRAALPEPLAELTLDSNAARRPQAVQPLRARVRRADAVSANDQVAALSKDTARPVVVDAPKVAARAAPTAPAPAPAPALSGANASAAGAMEMRTFTMPDPALRLAGCYRLESTPPPLAAVQGKAATAAERPQERSKTARLAPAPTAAAGAAAAVPEFVIPPVLRLDSAVLSAGRRAVVTAATGEALGTWTAAGGDSVRMVLVYAGAQTLTSSNRVTCPEVTRTRP